MVQAKCFGVVLSWVLAALASALIFTPAFAQGPSDHSGMQFRLAQDGLSEWIVAEGRIEAGTAEAFGRFLAALNRPVNDVLMHSPGGHLREGLALGTAIRAAGLNTHIGLSRPQGLSETVGPGLCASACAYAFLGGVTRHVETSAIAPQSSRIGFHGIRLAPDQGAVSADTLSLASQTMLVEVDRYVAAMGADERLPALSQRAGDVLFLPRGVILPHLGIETAPTPLDAAGLPQPESQAPAL